MSEITPDVVREYKEFTPKFLCSLDANTYNIQFKRFRIRDMESDFVLLMQVMIPKQMPKKKLMKRRRKKKWKKLRKKKKKIYTKVQD